MKKSNLFFITALVALLCILFGVFKKITHQANATLLLTIGYALFAVFYVMTIWDLLNRPMNDRNSKMLWLFLVLFLPLIGSLIYLGYANQNQKSKNQQ